MKKIIIATIFTFIAQNMLNAQDKWMECFTEGYKYGKCAFYSYNGLSCPKDTDITISYSCRNEKSTKSGIEGGIDDAKKEIMSILGTAR